MTTDKLTNEQVLQLLEESTAGVRCNSAIVVDLCDELLRLRAGLSHAKELWDGWPNGEAKYAADEILKGFEP